MGKRSPNFKRRKNDAYDTPYKAFSPLLPYIIPESSFCEPCAGNGHLIDHLDSNEFDCVSAYDTYPRRIDIHKFDALKLEKRDINNADYIITNPPWTRQILHPMIDIFRNITTTWLLFDADWAHTKQAEPYMEYCSMIVSIGRVQWIPDSKHVGMDNAAWYRFGKDKTQTIFKGRKSK
ncbi:MAG: hypothetical protein ACUZ8H_15510 [Candidatus Anammoxibacter sp.]